MQRVWKAYMLKVKLWKQAIQKIPKHFNITITTYTTLLDLKYFQTVFFSSTSSSPPYGLTQFSLSKTDLGSDSYHKKNTSTDLLQTIHNPSRIVFLPHLYISLRSELFERHKFQYKFLIHHILMCLDRCSGWTAVNDTRWWKL